MNMKYTKIDEMNKQFRFLLLALTISGILITGCGQSAAEPDPIKSNQTTITVGTGDLRISVIGSGALISASEYDLSYQISGTLQELQVEVGDQVQAGQTLAVLDQSDFKDQLIQAERELREITSESAAAEAYLELAEVRKDILSAESMLSFYLSPYVYKAELRYREAEDNLLEAQQNAADNPSEANQQNVLEAQEGLDTAALSLEMNRETYYDEYVPDFFNFRWRDEFGYWHDYYDPPAKTEIALVWAELAGAKATASELEAYLAALSEGVVPTGASGYWITELQKAGEAVLKASENLDETVLTSPAAGIVLSLSVQEGEQVDSSQTVLTVAQVDPPRMEASFDEGDWVYIQQGNPVEVVFDAYPDKVYSGEIIAVDPTLDESFAANSIYALIELESNAVVWPLSSSASVEVIAGEVNDAVLLTMDALQSIQGDTGLVQKLENGKIVEQEVTLGLRDVLYVEVIDGLSKGDTVLIETFTN